MIVAVTDDILRKIPLFRRVGVVDRARIAQVALEAVRTGLLSGMTLRLAELTRRLTDLSGSPVDARLARLFLKLADRIGTPNGNAVIVAMPLAPARARRSHGHDDRDGAICVMGRWHKDDMLRTEKEGFVIRRSRDARGNRCKLSGSEEAIHA